MVVAACARAPILAPTVASPAIGGGGGCGVAVSGKMMMATTSPSNNDEKDGRGQNPNNNEKTMMATVGLVDQLKQQLQLVVENGDLAAATALIGQLENAVLSKETLEATRIGRFVNDVRKQTAQQWPDFSKRCRALIKQWQRIAEYRPSSSCEGSSNGGTPALVSPAVRRGLTPRITTPGGGGKRVTPQQRITSTGLLPPDARTHITGQRSSSISPLENGGAIGSYAPLPAGKKKQSPQMLATILEQKQSSAMHKSASVGAAIHQVQAVQPAVNGLITGPSVEPEPSGGHGQPQPQNPPLMLKLKRTASGVHTATTAAAATTTASSTSNAMVMTSSTMVAVQQNANRTSASVSPQQQQLQSVHAARRNVQSTAELVAQLSEALPQHIGGIIDLSTVSTTTVNKVETTIITSKVSPDLPTSSSSSSITADVSGKGTKRRRGGRGGSEEMEGAMKQLKMGKDEGEKEEEKRMKTGEEEQEQQQPEQHPQLPETTKKGKRGRKKKVGMKQEQHQQEMSQQTVAAAGPAKFNWFSEYPLEQEDGAGPSTSAPAPDQVAEVRAAPTRSFVLPARDRQILLLPYLDIGLPDWRVHRFPHPERFLFPTGSGYASTGSSSTGTAPPSSASSK